jgi:excisionase family DNA binding protein
MGGEGDPVQPKQKEQNPMRRLVSIKEAAVYIGLSPYTLYTMVSQRRIPFVKMGRLVKFDLELLDKWIKQQTVMPMPSIRV